MFRIGSSANAASLPPAAIPDVEPHTYSLLNNRKGETVLAVTMSFGFYRPGVTTAYLSHFIDLSKPDEARRSPEGLACLSEKYLLQKDMKSLSQLYVRDEEEKESHAKADDNEPAGVVERLRVQARFGTYTYLGVNFSSMPELPTGNLLLQTPAGFAFDDDPKELPSRLFNLLAQDYGDYEPPQRYIANLDSRYSTVRFAAPNGDGSSPPAATIGGHKGVDHDSELRIAARFTTITAGTYRDFFDQFYNVLMTGDDDGIRKLFNSDSQSAVNNEMLQTLNGRQEFEDDRRCFQSGFPTNILLIDGDIEKFLIFKVTSGDPSSRNTSAPSRLFIYPCLAEHGKLLLSLAVGDTPLSLLVKYNNVPSDLCRQLVEVFDSQKRASSQP